MRTTRAIGAAATLFAVLAAAGCSGGSSGGGASSTTSHTPKGIASGESTPPRASTASSPASKSSTTQPTPTSKGTAAGAPGVPEPARQHTNAGAKAFVVYYFKTSNDRFRNPQKGTTEALELPGCDPCADNATGLKDMAAKKQHYDQDQIEYKITRVSNVDVNATNVFADLTQNPARLLDASGKVLSTTPTPRVKSVVLMKWIPGKGWRVKDLSHE